MSLKHFAKLFALTFCLAGGAFAPSCEESTPAPDMTELPDMSELPDMTELPDATTLPNCPVEYDLSKTTLPCNCFGDVVTQEEVDGCNKTYKCCGARHGHCE